MDGPKYDREWFVPGWIPRGQITILAGDGGVGKTTVWAALAAAVSTGTKVFFDTTPDFSPDKPGKVLFLSAEDDVACVLKPRLCKAGANEENLLTIPLTDANFSEYKIGSEKLENVVKLEMPELLMLDPLQAFLSSEVRMESRNAMRNTLNSLVQIGARYGTTILVVMHTNKRPGAYGFGRVAYAGNVVDAASSVLMVGETENGVRYLSHEKCNYGQLAETVLFTLDDKGAHFAGTTDKRERELMASK